jgi:hypothetical protein
MPSAPTLFIVRPGTSAEITAQSLLPCVCNASFSVMSSNAVHLPVRPLARLMLCFKASCHLCRHCLFVRPGIRVATATQSLPPCICTESFSLSPSSGVHLPVRLVVPPMLESKPLFHLLRHCFFSFDLEPARQFPSNSWHRSFAPHPSARFLRPLPIYPSAHSLG